MSRKRRIGTPQEEIDRTEPSPQARALFTALVAAHRDGDDDHGADLIQAWINKHRDDPGFGLLELVEAAVLAASASAR